MRTWVLSVLLAGVLLSCALPASAANKLFAMSVTHQHFMRVDLETVTLEDVGSVGTFVQDIAYREADDALYGYDFQDSQELLRIDPRSGATTPVGPSLTEFGWSFAHGLAYDPGADRLFATLAGDPELLRIDPSSGIPTLVGDLGRRIWSLAYDADQGVLYGTDVFDDSLVRIDTDDATTERVGPKGAVGGPVEGLAFNPADGMLYAVRLAVPVEDSMLITIDPQTAETVERGVIDTGDFISGLAFSTRCAADVDDDGVVDARDLIDLLSAWGPCVGCAEDLDGSGAVDAIDLLALLAAWGPCRVR